MPTRLMTATSTLFRTTKPATNRRVPKESVPEQAVFIETTENDIPV